MTPRSNSFLSLLILYLSSVSLEAATIDSLLSAFGGLTFSPQSLGQIEVLGQEIQNFISSPQNRSILSSPKGKELLSRQTKLLNYMSIKKTFDACVKASDRQLDSRILAAAAQSSVTDCMSTTQLGTSSLMDALSAIKSVTTLQAKSELQGSIYLQALKNAASNRFYFQRLSGNTNLDPKSILDSCKNQSGGDGCT